MEDFKKLVGSVMKNLVSLPVTPAPAAVLPGDDPLLSGPRRSASGSVTTPLAPPPRISVPPTMPVAHRPAPPACVVELIGVKKAFVDSSSKTAMPVFDDLNLELDKPGEFVVLLGPSGCGKSTVLSLISGSAQPDAGEVRVFGQNLHGANQHSATVPQAYTCFPWLSVIENVEFGLALQSGRSKQEIRATAMEYLIKVGLENRANARPRELSGGMQQRVAIARTLAVKRPIVLMDEPFGALDAHTREEMQQMLLRLWDEEKCTIVFVTHDITEALLLADRVVIFSARPARKVEDIVLPFPYERPLEILQQPEFSQWCAYLRQFFRPAATLVATVAMNARAADPPAVDEPTVASTGEEIDQSIEEGSTAKA